MALCLWKWLCAQQKTMGPLLPIEPKWPSPMKPTWWLSRTGYLNTPHVFEPQWRCVTSRIWLDMFLPSGIQQQLQLLQLGFPFLVVQYIPYGPQTQWWYAQTHIRYTYVYLCYFLLHYSLAKNKNDLLTNDHVLFCKCIWTVSANILHFLWYNVHHNKSVCVSPVE